jgi:hypothetical protein
LNKFKFVKFAYAGVVTGSSQFLLLPQLPQKIMLKNNNLIFLVQFCYNVNYVFFLMNAFKSYFQIFNEPIELNSGSGCSVLVEEVVVLRRDADEVDGANVVAEEHSVIHVSWHRESGLVVAEVTENKKIVICV